MALTLVRRIGRRLPARQAATALAVGDVVYINTDGKWAICDADSAGKAEARGVVTIAADEGEYPEVAESAHFDGFTGLTPGHSLFLGTYGITGTLPAHAIPSTPGHVVVKVGYALSETAAVIACTGYYQVVSGGS